ncbi:MAG: tRNA (N(6)-L-threonylcarbamoyladenosine(37)-C(2))-methylthiotransferase MtaB [Dehalococcoidia bacterium]|nr:tRNA (N(6)-L-threonylcarbamoyladenosine(37)-C(2))-methylthiotransferase MtaB [Dehalococcoidia bacterium]
MQIRNPRRIALHALGCKLNQAELQELALSFESQGFMVVGPRDEADVYFINTCTVTAEADRKVRQWLRAARRRHPGSVVVACGCGVERDRAQLEPLADLLISNRDKCRAVELVVAGVGDQSAGATASVVEKHVGRTRSLVKVQEGCATPCTYCIVPYVRRGEKSVPVDLVLSTVKARIAAGYREIVLTGTKPGAYRDGEVDLAGLVSRNLQISGLERLRLSSLQPRELTDGLLDLWRDSRLCRHFHLSLQSGSRTVLERMRRAYEPEEYIRALQRVRSSVPGAAITTDVIIGFPAETEEEFQESVTFCEAAGFARMHLFPYSRRPGTPAADMPAQVPADIVRRRVAAMAQVDRSSRMAYASSWLGRTVRVLWEEETSPGSGIYAGNSDNYIQVLGRSDTPLQNVMEEVILDRLGVDGAWVRR